MTVALALLAIAFAACALVLAGERGRRLRAERSAAVARQQLENQREQMVQLQAGLSAAGEGLILLDADERVVAANEAAQEFAQLPSGGCRGRAVGELIHWPRLREAIAA
ncbi:MAG: PAS domain-containing protein, partial [Planctomycetota bacterium]